MSALETAWYQPRGWTALLLPLAWLYGAIVSFKRWAYQQGLCRVHRLDVPVIVVGNLTAGGTGKTPLTLALAQRLQARGLKVGIVSRGYGGKAPAYPCVVTADTPVAWSGDEPALIARQLRLPVVVDPDRVRAAQTLRQQFLVDVIVSDDGLQHLRLARDSELVVIDGRRQFGNGWLIPAGPLREPVTRLGSVDAVLMRDGPPDEAGFVLALGQARDLRTGEVCALVRFSGEPVQAIAGIGYPQGFFQQLQALGLRVQGRAFPDHHAYSADDLAGLPPGPVLMTEKDAIKCQSHASQFPPGRLWSVAAEARLNPPGEHILQALVDRLLLGRHIRHPSQAGET